MAYLSSITFSLAVISYVDEIEINETQVYYANVKKTQVLYSGKY